MNQKSPSKLYPFLKGTIALSILVLLGTPLASAVSMGPLGDVRSGHWSIYVLGVGFVALALLGFHKWLSIKPTVPILALVASLLILVGGNGFFATGAAPGTASIVGATTSTSGATTTYSAALYESTSDITFQFMNAYNKTAINPTIALYLSATTTEKAVAEGSAFPDVPPATATGGTVTRNWQSQVWGCELDAHLDLAGYYEALVHVPQPGQPSACAAKDAVSHTNDVTLPPLAMKAIGTFDIDDGTNSLTCAAGADCIYPLTVKNGAGASYLEHVAVKIGTLTNATVNSIDPSSAAECSLELNSDGSQYVVIAAEIGPLKSITCNVHISRATGSTEGSAVFTGDDLYRQYDAPAFVTNTNIRSAAVSDVLTVSFA